ncbi:Hypothetical protein LBF_2168 [Leptospira biflexa serovar Patoc strain 'Patoc 1 (Ames)']|uniref:Uncharacterized protein n=1 Tax=Leptospira biflexa serovar Patoc (strain Patoc 1 / ATCC 23582 / Paris) TaxID=456481 RepID=B0ST86_LEPBP|nr:hypothetical protein [Leptospira biflexa]ABZ94665.1 Hypothetical protein LBF_2168 [Leptospira biflexa serovar Patoc strain 'Patoc 1 (Ames)']ABZ98326.1 Hypothetical protein LEPBI_I2229 [Leptospira biflexa serovar Patoc strain 'Patoc 1 (Paris)']
MKLKNVLFLSLAVYSVLNCGHYNQTRKITRKSFGNEKFIINTILDVKRIEKNKILIIADTTTLLRGHIQTRPPQPSLQRCFQLELEENEPREYYHYHIKTAYFSDECETTSIDTLDFFEVHKTGFYNYNENGKKEVISLKLDDDNYYQIFLEGREYKQNPFYIVHSRLHKQNKYSYILLYTAALPYDIIAGTLHSIGMPFLYTSYLFGSLSNQEQPLYKKKPLYFLLGTYRTLSYLDKID